MAFERSVLAQKSENEIMTLLSTGVIEKTLDPDLVFKSTYILDFLNLPYLHSERELENAILLQLEKIHHGIRNWLCFS